MAAIAITRKDLTATELRAAAAKTKDARATRRMLAIALVLEGKDRETAAETCGMDRQTLRDWVHRYNAKVWRGLRTAGRRPGRGSARRAESRTRRLGRSRPRSGTGRRGAVAARRSQTPDRGGIPGEAARAHGWQVAGGARLRRLTVRPRHPKSDPEAQEAFKKTSPRRLRPIPEHARGKPLEIWFQDEARVGQQGTLTRIWAKRGSRPRAPRDTRRMGLSLRGGLPGRGVAAGLVLPYANTAAMYSHLAEIARTVAPGAHAVLILDGAG